jgi:hypothetical protein
MIKGSKTRHRTYPGICLFTGFPAKFTKGKKEKKRKLCYTHHFIAHDSKYVYAPVFHLEDILDFVFPL